VHPPGQALGGTRRKASRHDLSTPQASLSDGRGEEKTKPSGMEPFWRHTKPSAGRGPRSSIGKLGFTQLQQIGAHVILAAVQFATNLP
jgi:hypothetical protein